MIIARLTGLSLFTLPCWVPLTFLSLLIERSPWWIENGAYMCLVCDWLINFHILLNQDDLQLRLFCFLINSILTLEQIRETRRCEMIWIAIPWLCWLISLRRRQRRIAVMVPVYHPAAPVVMMQKA